MITFKSVECRNFFSVGSTPIKVLLNKSQTTLVVGKNGSGKSSTILDAINFGLFGKPFRNINKPQVINSINQSDCVVELDFEVGSKQYKVRRGMKPNVFEIFEDGKLINQDAAARDYQKYLEDSILCGLNERVFKQVVVIGSADYKPFMMLPAGQRREVIEELLDIKIFSQMLTIAKEKIVTLRDTLKNLDYDVELQQERIKLQKDNKKRIKEQVKEKKLLLEGKIAEENATIETIQTQIDAKMLEKEKYALKLPILPVVSKSITEWEGVRTELSTTHNAHHRTVEFFTANNDCPTCKQGIPHTHKESIVKDTEVKKKEILEKINLIDTELEKKRKNLEILNKVSKLVTKLEREIYQLQVDITSHQKNIQRLQKDITELSDNQHSVEADTLLKAEEAALGALKSRRLELIEERQYHETASEMLKDGGIKTKIIRQYVPIMNKIINEYLVRFMLPIEFTLDENFNEVIKSRFRDTFEYNNFSEGEKGRINVALLLAWRQIARAKNTTNCNLLVMDETFDSSLDSAATEELLNVLLEMDKNTNIFIVSHKTDLGDKLRSTITFEKIGNFTRIAA